MRALRSTIIVWLALFASACSRGESIAPSEAASIVRTADVPPEHEKGSTIYGASCAVCHGLYGQGGDLGPPMLHPLQAQHHSDLAFRRAIEEGVRPHHYDLGSMPPLPELTEADENAVIAYLRWMQRTAGLR